MTRQADLNHEIRNFSSGWFDPFATPSGNVRYFAHTRRRKFRETTDEVAFSNVMLGSAI
jgi:hypothetical protein